MKIQIATAFLIVTLCLVSFAIGAESSAASRDAVQSRVQQEYPSLFELYKDLHAHPELSFEEEKTAARLAEQLRKAGYEVTTGVGKHGVVALLRNGKGLTVLVRTDLDALPVKEQTGLSYASRVRATDDKGNDVDVMHACGHDVHMTVQIGTDMLFEQIPAYLEFFGFRTTTPDELRAVAQINY